MTLYVNRPAARPLNIEIEGTGVAMCWSARKLPGVIFFANTGVRFSLLFEENRHAMFEVIFAFVLGCFRCEQSRKPLRVVGSLG